MNLNEFKATLIPGQLCNVSFPGHEPMMRVVKTVETKRHRGKQWLFWNWETGRDHAPTATTPRGTRDCGYSGVEIEYHESLGDLG